jgi:hypothetical protein
VKTRGPSPLKVAIAPARNDHNSLFSASVCTDPEAQHAIPSEFLESGMHTGNNQAVSSTFSTKLLFVQEPPSSTF